MNTLQTKHSREKVEEYKLEIQEILGVLDPQNSPLDEDLGEIGGAFSAASDPSVDTASISVAQSGTSIFPHLPSSYGILVIP